MRRKQRTTDRRQSGAKTDGTRLRHTFAASLTAAVLCAGGVLQAAPTAPSVFSNRLALVKSGIAISARNASTVRRYCVRHRHGDHWHSCSDTRHPVYDVAHSHTSQPVIYRPSTGRGSTAARGSSTTRGSSPAYDSGRGYLYFGIKSGSMKLDIDATDSGLPKGVVIGYAWSEHAIEFENLSTSLSTDNTNDGSLSGGFSSSYAATSVYGVRIIGDRFYTKMKVGLTRHQQEIPQIEKSGTDASAGVGLGWKTGTIVLEGEYTLIGSSAKFLSVGASIVF